MIFHHGITMLASPRVVLGGGGLVVTHRLLDGLPLPLGCRGVRRAGEDRQRHLHRPRARGAGGARRPRPRPHTRVSAGTSTTMSHVSRFTCICVSVTLMF